MSRIGKKPVPIPAGTDVTVSGGTISVKGENGDLSFEFHSAMKVDYDDAAREVRVTRP